MEEGQYLKTQVWFSGNNERHKYTNAMKLAEEIFTQMFHSEFVEQL